MSTREEVLIPFNEDQIFLIKDIPRTELKGLIIISHGLTGDRTGPQGLLSKLSKHLADNGMLVIRFDFRGSGDSTGCFEKTTFTSMLEDVGFVTQWAKKEYFNCPVGMLGLSIGGVVATLGAIEHKCKALSLLSSDLIENIAFKVNGLVPIREGQLYLEETFFRERENLYPRTRLLESNIPTKLLYGELDEKVSTAVQSLRGSNIYIEEVNGVDHLFETTEARNLINEKLTQFFLKQFKGEKKSERNYFMLNG